MIRRISEIHSRPVLDIIASVDTRGGTATAGIKEKRRAYVAAAARAGHAVEVARITDERIPTPHGGIALRVYEGRTGTSGLAVLYLHGGGFVSGNLATHDPVCRALASAAGCTVVLVDYRLAPEHPFPAALEDCRDAIKWMAERWKDTRLVVAGDSAGGNLAAATALWAHDQEDVKLGAQVLIYPMLDATLAGSSLVENGLIPPFTLLDAVYVWQQYLPDGQDRREPFISPLHAPVLDHLPKTLLITAEFDILRSEGSEYADRLRASGVTVQHLEVPDMPHGFIQWGGTVPEAGEAIERIAEFLTRL